MLSIGCCLGGLAVHRLSAARRPTGAMEERGVRLYGPLGDHPRLLGGETWCMGTKKLPSHEGLGVRKVRKRVPMRDFEHHSLWCPESHKREENVTGPVRGQPRSLVDSLVRARNSS